MRIDAYQQITNIYNSSKPSRVKNGSGAKSTDKVQISQSGQDYQIAKNAVKQSPDIREDKVATLKAKIDSGEYQVNPGDFAAKLLGSASKLN